MKNFLFSFIFFLGMTFSAYSQIDSIIYGICGLPQDTVILLAKINPLSGQVINITPTPVSFPLTTCSSTLDPNSRHFYFLTDSIIITFNMTTGEVINKVKIDNIEGTEIYSIEFDTYNNTIYGLAYDVVGQQVFLTKLNSETGEITKISMNSVSDNYKVLTRTALDPLNQIFYFESVNSHLIGISLLTGDVVSNTVIGMASGIYFGPLSINCHDSTIYGLVGNGSIGRKLAKINPKTGIVSEISTDTIVGTILNVPATIDPFKNIYYFQNVSYQFVGADLHSGTVVSNPLIIQYPNSYFNHFLYNFTCYDTISTNINDEPSLYEIKIYPNPVHDELFIDHIHKNANVIIVDMLGNEVLNTTINNSSMCRLNLTFLRSGVYLVKIISCDAITTSKILVVK